MSDIKGATHDLAVDERHEEIARLEQVRKAQAAMIRDLRDENAQLEQVRKAQADMIRDLRKEVEELKARSRETAGVRLAVDITQAYSSQRRKLDPQVSDWHSAAAEDLAAEEARLAEADALRRENGKKC